MNRDVFIGGAWPYANYFMHIGHLAALLPGDVLARYFRGNGDNVIYVSGTDSHGTPITQRAIQEKVTSEEIAKRYHKAFIKSFTSMNFEYDLYTATFTEEHKKLVKEYFLKLIKNGYIYEKTIKQDYCEKCSKFLSDREIVGVCPKCGGKASGEQCDDCLTTLNADEVKDKHCKECGEETTLKENKHLYFKLSAFQKQIEDLINSSENTWRKQAVGESRKFLNNGLIDRAATRQLEWGIEVPVKGYEDKRIYVWIEAVLGYLTTGKRVAEARGINFEKFMSKDNPNLLTYYIHGKDNIPFHTIIYPALILGIGNGYQLPKYIVSSGYINMNDTKMSKSKGNLITVDELVEKFDVDSIRYFMIANGPEKKDTNFTEELYAQAHNKFLVGMLGNFVNRNLSFINKKFDGIIKEAKVDPEIIKMTEDLYKKAGNLIEQAELKAAIEEIFDYIGFANKYYDEKEPWKQCKENMKEFNNTTYTCTYIIVNISNLIAPFMPNTSKKIKKMLNLPDFKWEQITLKGDIKINELELLFNRIDLE